MTVIEHIGSIAEAVLPLMTLCFGVMLGIDLAEWLAARASKKKESGKDTKPEDKANER